MSKSGLTLSYTRKQRFYTFPHKAKAVLRSLILNGADFPKPQTGSTTLVHGSIIVGKGGTVLIHPPSPPPGGGKSGPPGFGDPIRPLSGGKKCPSFLGISFCPPGYDIAPPGASEIDPDETPEGSDPGNPDNEENNEEQKSDESESEKTTQNSKSSSQTSNAPSSVSASTTGSQSSSSSSSSTTSCSASGDCGCVTLDFSPLVTPNPLGDDDDIRKRQLGGRFVKEKRANNYQSIRTGKAASGQCPVSSYTIKPIYPGPKVVSANEANASPEMQAFYETATYWAIPSQKPCQAPTWNMLGSNELNDWNIGTNKGKYVNIDHVCTGLILVVN